MNKKLLLIVLSASLLLSTAAVADDEGYYLGLNVGQASMDEFCDGLGGLGLSCDDTDTSWKVSGGYMFNQYVGVELSYNDLGEAKLSDGIDSLSISADAFVLSVIGSIPVNDSFSLFGKMGYADWDADIKENGSNIASASDNDFVYGVGAKFNSSEDLGWMLEWERFDLDGLDVDVISLGFQFSL